MAVIVCSVMIAILVYLILPCIYSIVASDVISEFDQNLPPRTNFLPITHHFILSEPFCNHCGDLVFSPYYLNETHLRLFVRRLDGLHWNTSFGLVLCSDTINCTHSQQIVIEASAKSYREVIILVKSGVFHVERSLTQQQLVPKTIIRTYRSRQPENEYHFNAHQNLIDLNPEYEVVMLTDRECREFIKHHFSSRYLAAYDLLIAPTFKADFFRYAYLITHGGCYFDHKMILRVPLRTIIKPTDDLLVCADADKSTGEAISDMSEMRGIYNAMICSQRRDRRIIHTLWMVVGNIERRHSSGSEWSLTGPLLFYKAIYRNITDSNIRFKHGYMKGSHDYRDYDVVERNSNRLVANKFFPQIQRNPKQSYGHMWRRGIIYYDLLHRYRHWKVYGYANQRSCFSSTINFSGRLILSFPLDLYISNLEQPFRHATVCSTIHVLFLNDETSEQQSFAVPHNQVGNTTDIELPFPMS